MRVLLLLLPISLFASEPNITVFCEKNKTVYEKGIVKIEGLEGKQALNTHIKLIYQDGRIEYVPKSLDCLVVKKVSN